MNRPRPLLVATNNGGKLKEIRHLLSELPLDLQGLSQFPRIEVISETGTTFIENASLKAAGYAKQTGMLTLADDSGLEVDALDGAPGVFSARYGDDGDSDAQRTTKLLAALSNISAAKRTARFISVIAIANADGQVLNLSEGRCDGRIDFSPRGSRGFGYDPVFIPIGYEKSFAEMEPEIKNQMSHRARALLSARDFLRTLTIP